MTGKIILQDRPKGYVLDQDKWIHPEETVKRLRDRLKRIDLDILQGTTRIDNGRLGIPVFFSICGRDAEAVMGTRKQMGKGGTPTQAEASAIMELAERFSFFSFSGNPDHFLVDTYANLKDRALPFEAIARSVHDDSADLDRAREAFSRLPMRWCTGTNLTRQKETLVPFDWFYAINEFNGASAGNCTEEALLQGICEVVERHVSSLVSRNRISTPGLRLDGVTDEVVRDMLGKYERTGVRIFVNDFTQGMGIPTVAVLAYDPATFPARSEIVWTAGTTPSPQKSLSRALTEVAQLGGDFNSGSSYVASGLPKLNRLHDADFVVHPESQQDLLDLPDLSDENLRVEVENCLNALNAGGMEVIAVETIHPLLAVPAFYTMIPGAHFRERARGTSVGMFTARLFTEQGDPRRALDELARMEDLLPGKYYIRFYQGLSLFSLGDMKAALARLKDALDLGPHTEDIPTIYSYMGQCLKELEQYRDALRVLEKGALVDPERTDIHNLMGFCHFKLKEHDQAVQSFQRVLALDPSSAMDHANIAVNYRETGDRENAVRHFRIALELDSSIDFARRGLEQLQGE